MARVERRSRGWRLALSAPGPSAAAVAIGLMLAGGARRPDAADPPCRFSGIDRVVAVGDVHGAYDRFVGILQTAGLVDARLRWTGGSAHLVQLGDVVDRGPDSARVLDLLQRLQKEAPRQGGAVHPLLGNHEVMRMLGDLRYVSAGEYNAFVTLKSEALRQKFVRSGEAGPGQSLETIPLGFVELRLAFGRGGVYGAWLRTLQAVVDIDGVLFLHGGISPIVADLPCEAR